MNKRHLVQRLYNMTTQFNRITMKCSQSIMQKSEHFLISLLLKHYRESQTLLTSRDIADLTHVSSPAISRTVKSLVQKGWIKQIDNPEDRRNIFLEVTDEGEENFNRTFQEIDSTIQAIFNEFSEREILEYIETGEKITHIMEKIYKESEES
ncbi:MarR family transcriptional regulator [Aerococcaceae bacterium WGS1372]